MNRSDIATLGLKLVGVYAIVLALSHTEAIGLAISAVGSGRMEGVAPLPWAFGALIPFVLLLVSGLLLVLCAEQIGRIIVGNQETQPVDTALSSADVQALAFSVVGVGIACLALPRLGRIVVNAGLLHGSTGQAAGARFRTRAWAQAIGPAIQLLVGTALFFGGRNLSRIWQKLQGQDVKTS